jgi:dTDP-4-dehydrorhamnose 3,5-epimerase
MAPTWSHDVAPVTIEGVVLKQLVTHADERGFFREVIRETDDFFDRFAQWSHSLMYAGTAKAWHIHQRQTDWWYVIGAIKVALYDTREGSPTRGKLMEFMMGDLEATCLRIPPGVAHGCRAMELSHILYVTSHVYAPEDEGRIPHDDPTIGYDWTAGPTIK